MKDLKNIIYFDNAASTRPTDEVINFNNELMSNYYANPSAKHVYGKKCEDYVIEATEIIAQTLRVKSSEIVFTSGGTESNNMAIFGIADAYKRNGKHIITTKIEHSAVKEPILALKNKGYDVTFLDVDTYGQINIDDFKKAIRNDTILISIMMVNNEIGTLEDIYKLATIAKEINKNVIFHTDAVQAYGKYNIRPKNNNIDLLSVSAHKFHGPKGVGFLYVKDGIKLPAFIIGGGQQAGMRSGTLNTYGYASMGLAAKLAYDNLDKKTDYLTNIRNYLIDELSKLDGIIINTQKNAFFAPHIVSMSIRDIKSEVLLHALEEKNIYVSAGSACATHKIEKSSTLQAIGLDTNLQDGTIRVSLSCYNTLDDAVTFISELKSLIPLLKKFVRK